MCNQFCYFCPLLKASLLFTKLKNEKTFLLLLCVSCLLSSYGQLGNLFSKKKKDTTAKSTVIKPTVVTTAPVAKVDLKKADVSKRAADHFMLQFGSDTWLNRPDSVATKGFSRHFNFYFMLDKPLKKTIVSVLVMVQV